MRIKKNGCVIPFDCGMCDCEFVVAMRSVKEDDGNFYALCPECGCGCHTAYNRFDAECSQRIAEWKQRHKREENGNND